MKNIWMFADFDLYPKYNRFCYNWRGRIDAFPSAYELREREWERKREREWERKREREWERKRERERKRELIWM